MYRKTYDKCVKIIFAQLQHNILVAIIVIREQSSQLQEFYHAKNFIFEKQTSN